MNKKAYAVIAATLVLGGVLAFSLPHKSFAQAGDATDPLATKSYVDTKFNEILRLAGSSVGATGTPSASLTETQKAEIVSELLAKVEGLITQGGSKEEFEPGFIQAGQTITLDGGTEFALRSGTAKAFITGENGLSDFTDGVDLLNGQNVPVNHLIIVPRSDGRGIIAVTDCWFIVKGAYSVV
ncbi:MAG: hypothetical protein LBM16_05245 [Clostridiales bacterium]|jgi:hypothetical protein|nr:hypothetical protein [Clostridiales bacterium]